VSLTNQTIDRPTIANMSLLKLGHPQISGAIDPETRTGSILDRVWYLTAAKCFGLHDWPMCRRTSKLNRHAESPDNGWRYQFDLSGDRLGPPLKVLRQAGSCPVPMRDYAFEGQSLFANEPDCWTVDKVDPDPSIWDPAFVAAFSVAYASGLAVPLQQDVDMKFELHVEAFGTRQEKFTGGMFGRLITLQRTSEPVDSPYTKSNPFTDVRF